MKQKYIQSFISFDEVKLSNKNRKTDNKVEELVPRFSSPHNSGVRQNGQNVQKL